MLTEIIKRDGTIEEFIPSKLNKWASWSVGDLPDVDWSSIVLKTIRGLSGTIKSQDLQKQLINTCIYEKDWVHNLMAGRLYKALLDKEIYDNKPPTVLALHNQLRTMGLMTNLNYTEEEYAVIETIIDHNKDFNYAHFQLSYILGKYSIQNRVTGVKYETPQYVYMRCAMALSESEVNKLEAVKRYYHFFSDGIINQPTPNLNNLGTNHHGYASCCVYASDDKAKSLAIGDHIAYTMTYMSAGIGNTIMSRSLGDSVRNGAIEHQGKLPYYKALAGAVMANKQGSRGGSCTTYYLAYDPEAFTITLLRNPRTPKERQNRDLHYGIMTNKFFADAVITNKQLFSFNKKTAPILFDTFYSGDDDLFKTVYANYEADPTFVKKYFNPRQLIVSASQQALETGTIYFLNISEVNRHTPFKDPIYSSNLCVAPETLVLTNKGNLPISKLVDTEIEVWNGDCWSNVTIRKTGSNQKLLRVTLTSGKKLECTSYHRWVLTDDSMKTTAELKPQDQLKIWSLPIEYCDNETGEIEDTVLSVTDSARVDDTYCFTEPLKNMGVFNGILTMNCNEILEPTLPYQEMSDLYSTKEERVGEVALCNIAAINVATNMTDAEYEEAMYYTLKMIDKTIHMSEYELPHLEVTAKARLNAGIGIIGLAYYLANKGLDYSSPAGLREIHKVAERHMYFAIKASLRLGKELGNAQWINRTKWPDGWLPIDTYNKRVDELVEPNYRYDWETLRKEVIANGGIRNSVLIAHMPTESSSKATGVPNGLYPIREVHKKKTDGTNVTDWVANESNTIGHQYQLAWDIPTVDLIKAYSVVQKFTDQGISADTYEDRSKEITIKTSYLLDIFLAMTKYGLKSRYYTNIKTTDDGNVTEDVGCSGGGCSV